MVIVIRAGRHPLHAQQEAQGLVLAGSPVSCPYLPLTFLTQVNLGNSCWETSAGSRWLIDLCELGSRTFCGPADWLPGQPCAHWASPNPLHPPLRWVSVTISGLAAPFLLPQFPTLPQTAASLVLNPGLALPDPALDLDGFSSKKFSTSVFTYTRVSQPWHHWYVGPDNL